MLRQNDQNQKSRATGSNIPAPKEIPPAPDQTMKADAGKLQLTLVPPEIIYAIARIREYGCEKYPDGGKDNWKRVEPQRYFEALARHILAAWDDYEKIDPESGYMHLEHAATNIAFLLELIRETKGNAEI